MSGPTIPPSLPKLPELKRPDGPSQLPDLKAPGAAHKLPDFGSPTTKIPPPVDAGPRPLPSLELPNGGIEFPDLSTKMTPKDLGKLKDLQKPPQYPQLRPEGTGTVFIPRRERAQDIADALENAAKLPPRILTDCVRTDLPPSEPGLFIDSNNNVLTDQGQPLPGLIFDPQKQQITDKQGRPLDDAALNAAFETVRGEKLPDTTDQVR